MSRSLTLTLSIGIVSALLLTAYFYLDIQKTATESVQLTPVAAPAETTPSEANLPSASPEAVTQKLTRVETSYQSPGGEEKVAFSLIVDREGIITDATTEVLGKNPTTIMRQESFAKDFPAALKGKKLSALTEVDRIGGSSLTTGAFNAALDDLKAQI